jgi:hypothetical protein
VNIQKEKPATKEIGAGGLSVQWLTLSKVSSHGSWCDLPTRGLLAHTDKEYQPSLISILLHIL